MKLHPLWSLGWISTNQMFIGFIVDLAGARKENLSLKWQNNTLLIEGMIYNEHKETSYKNIRNERFYGSFKREIVIPRNCEIEHIQAIFENGVLWITVPFYRGKNKDDSGTT